MGSGIGVGGFILIILLALILFGPRKLPELGRAIGVTLREFKQATRGLTQDDDESEKERAQAKAAAVPIGQAAEKETVDRAALEKEIRERLERERLEAEIRAKLEQERLSQAKTEESRG